MSHSAKKISRDQMVHRIIQTLTKSVANSAVKLRGSLADGSSDFYSDIDLEWRVPADWLVNNLDETRRILEDVLPILAFRIDPDSYSTPNTRLVFMSFKDAPLFWRLDLKVSAINHISIDKTVGDEARFKYWSDSVSALMNGVAAIKCIKRGQPKEAIGLVERGLQRIGYQEVHQPFPETIVALAHLAKERDPSSSELADGLIDLFNQYIDVLHRVR